MRSGSSLVHAPRIRSRPAYPRGRLCRKYPRHPLSHCIRWFSATNGSGKGHQRIFAKINDPPMYLRLYRGVNPPNGFGKQPVLSRSDGIAKRMYHAAPISASSGIGRVVANVSIASVAVDRIRPGQVLTQDGIVPKGAAWRPHGRRHTHDDAQGPPGGLRPRPCSRRIDDLRRSRRRSDPMWRFLRGWASGDYPGGNGDTDG